MKIGTNAPGVIGGGLAVFCPNKESNCPGTAGTAPGLGTAGTGTPTPGRPGTSGTLLFNGNLGSTTGVRGVSGSNAVSDSISLLKDGLKTPKGLSGTKCTPAGKGVGVLEPASGSNGPRLGAG